MPQIPMARCWFGVLCEPWITESTSPGTARDEYVGSNPTWGPYE